MATTLRDEDFMGASDFQARADGLVRLDLVPSWKEQVTKAEWQQSVQFSRRPIPDQ